MIAPLKMDTPIGPVGEVRLCGNFNGTAWSAKRGWSVEIDTSRCAITIAIDESGNVAMTCSMGDKP